MRIRTLTRVAAAALVILASPAARAVQIAPYQCPEQLTNETKISPSDGNLGGFFGQAVDVDGDFAVAAAPGDDDDGVPNAGAIYVYHKDAGGVWNQEAKLRPLPSQLGDLFGQSVAISGDTVAVGAPGTTLAGLPRTGAVYVYRRNVAGIWGLEAFVTAIDPGPQIGPIGDQFGFAVDLRGDRLVAGATNDDDIASDAGAAYVFDRTGTTWTQTSKLHAGDGAGIDSRFYGNDVAVDGNTIVVGITHDHTLGLDAGAAYTYAFNGTSWIESKIFAADGKAFDVFGRNVAVSGTFLVAGAYGDDDSPAGSQQLFKGAAYVFERNGAGAWIQKAKLVDPNGGNQDYFGTQVAIAGSTVILGNEELPSAFGHAHAYRRNPTTGAWQLLAHFQSSDIAPGDGFGIAVSVRGKTLMVGAFGDDGVAPNSGSVYFYDVVAICPTVP